MITAEELAAADPTLTANYRDAEITFIKERFPTLAVNGGAAADLIISPIAAALASLDAAAQSQSEKVNVQTALEAGTNPSELTGELAAVGISIISAAKASGNVVVVVENDSNFTIPASSVFEAADGTQFSPIISYNFYSSTTTATGVNGEVILEETEDSKFSGVFSVAAISTGATGNKVAGTALTPTTAIIENEEYYVDTTFTGGRDSETAEQILARVGDVTAPRTSSSVAGAEAITRATLNGIDSYLVVVGYTDNEMTRGISPLGTHLPGTVDVVIKPKKELARTLVPVTATYVDADGGDGVWRVTLTPEDCTGIAYVERAYQDNGTFIGNSYETIITGRGYDEDSVPDWVNVVDGADAAFTVYGTVEVEFTDIDTSISGLTLNVSTRDYVLAVRNVIEVEEVNAALQEDEVRPSGGDILCRGGTPVKIIADIDINAYSSATLDEDTIAAAFANAVNSTGFGLNLNLADIVASIPTSLLPSSVISGISLIGTVYKKDGTTSIITGTTGLQTIADYEAGIGANVLAYYCDDVDVSVNVTYL